MTTINNRVANLVLLSALSACHFGVPTMAPLVDSSSDSIGDGAIDTVRAEHMMLVLIDTTGSMATSRIDGSDRLGAARELAKDRIRDEAGTAAGLAGVAVYTFHDTGIDAKTIGFIDPVTAINTIDTIVPTFDLSPMAGSICDAIDILAAPGNVTITKMLEMYADGGENNTAPAHSCFGPSSNTDFPPFDSGSWQNKVLARAIDSGVQISTTLFAIPMLAANLALNPNPKVAAVTWLGRSSAPLAPLSDSNFFSTLTSSTGGQFRLVFDDQPLPAVADPSY